MKYFVLHYHYSGDHDGIYHQGPYEDVGGGDVQFPPPLPDYYYSGKPVDLCNRSIRVEMSKSVKRLCVDFFSTMAGCFFASEKLTALLKFYQNDLQIIPADVCYGYGKRKSVEKPFFLIHADHELQCFDYEKSDYADKAVCLERLASGQSPDISWADEVTSVVIDEKQAAGNNYFFLKNTLVIPPIISEPLANVIQEEKLNVRLQLLPKFDWPW